MAEHDKHSDAGSKLLVTDEHDEDLRFFPQR